MKYNRIIIVGSAGSGKSYLAKKIAEITRYPLIHLDNEYWKPGWTKTPREEWIERQKDIMATEKWILDGNYNSTLELRFEASDVVIFLDTNRFVCTFRVLKRHGKKRSDLPDHCNEKFGLDFVNFLRWIWKFPNEDKLKIMELHKKYDEKRFVVIKSRCETKKMMVEIRENTL